MTTNRLFDAVELTLCILLLSFTNIFATLWLCNSDSQTLVSFYLKLTAFIACCFTQTFCLYFLCTGLKSIFTTNK